jgi:hypothetical protein
MGNKSKPYALSQMRTITADESLANKLESSVLGWMDLQKMRM